MKILFLGNSGYRVCDFLVNEGHEVTQILDPVNNIDDFDLRISFGYRHIIPKEVIKDNHIFNLHISYLPWNRGAHPNFWAHYDGTPHGVTIHLITQYDQGVDTGPIVFQKRIEFSPKVDTFRKTYSKLVWDAEDLFLDHHKDILTGNCVSVPQSNSYGSFHKKKDLPSWVDWDMKVNVIRLVKAEPFTFSVTGV